jgi:hypothetical protein
VQCEQKLDQNSGGRELLLLVINTSGYMIKATTVEQARPEKLSYFPRLSSYDLRTLNSRVSHPPAMLLCLQSHAQMHSR